MRVLKHRLKLWWHCSAEKDPKRLIAFRYDPICYVHQNRQRHSKQSTFWILYRRLIALHHHFCGVLSEIMYWAYHGSLIGSKDPQTTLILVEGVWCSNSKGSTVTAWATISPLGIKVSFIDRSTARPDLPFLSLPRQSRNVCAWDRNNSGYWNSDAWPELG